MVLLADIPSTGLLGENQARRFPMKGGELAERSDEFIDFAQHHIGQGNRIIALYPKWHAEPAKRAIAFARGSLQTDHIGKVGLNIPPLALSLIADQMAYLAPYVPPGVVAALATELPSYVLAGAWLKRVNNLATIPITFKQHIGSYVPGTTFLAFSAPANRVGRVQRRDPSRNIAGRPVEPVQVLVSRPEGANIEEFNTQFTPALRPVSLNALPEQPLSATYWGMRKYIEFVAFSGHPEALANTVRSVRPTPCAWCRQLGTSLICPFCEAARQLQAGRPPARNADVPPPPAKTTGEHIRPAWLKKRNKQQDDQNEQRKAAPFPLHPGPALTPQRQSDAQPRPTSPPRGPQSRNQPQQSSSDLHASMAAQGKLPNEQPLGLPSGSPAEEPTEPARPARQPPSFGTGPG